jgi:hypothetical protein
VSNVLYFPLRRICALGMPEDALQAVHAALPHVAISTEGDALQRCDLLLIDSRDAGAMDLVQWIRQRKPHFPVVLWDAGVGPAARLVDECRLLLFPGDSSAA